jgi:hypothetical protein
VVAVQDSERGSYALQKKENLESHLVPELGGRKKPMIQKGVTDPASSTIR